ncbi:hypothetical protein RHMOL_Rhmol03G0154300 [Rhododendron molle]|uniref:Uncharacterized protein n=3 Tax=Rhododendron molle TaxID=49168 RepID=A0ACC0PHF0_RHOML|nr:hypothetical protein RHMOL_Rhmol03G0154300 [Rhododendron molle]KAI8564069.1 hypothetical protein RHMOL_Rhmol03G0154300 [Rhododendron molle]KAI8564075.1 hypothetical protein RHMOL_Rhmol03G0154300 [Rhododendron molle]
MIEPSGISYVLGFHQKASICLGKFVEGDSAGTVMAFYVIAVYTGVHLEHKAFQGAGKESTYPMKELGGVVAIACGSMAALIFSPTSALALAAPSPKKTTGKEDSSFEFVLIHVPFVRWAYKSHPPYISPNGVFYYVIAAGGQRIVAGVAEHRGTSHVTFRDWPWD